MPFYTGSCRSSGPSLITPGVILKHVSVRPLGFPVCTGKEKNFPCSSPPLIRSSLFLKRVTLIQSRSLCVSVKILPSRPLPSRQVQSTALIFEPKSSFTPGFLASFKVVFMQEAVLNKIDSYAPKPRPRLIHALAGTNFTKQEYFNMKRIPWTKIKNGRRSLSSRKGICSSFDISVLFNKTPLQKGFTEYCVNI